MVNENVSIPIEMAIPLTNFFSFAAETWLGMQMAFEFTLLRDLGQMIDIERIVAGPGRSTRPSPIVRPAGIAQA